MSAAEVAAPTPLPCPAERAIANPSAALRLILQPVTLKAANEFVALYHRHCQKTWRNGGKFAIGCVELSRPTLLGVVIVGRPIARGLDDGWTAEVLRLCVGSVTAPNACSMLYRAAWRAWRAMGGRRLVTYTLVEESGASLRGAGLVPVAQVRGESWNRAGRHRQDRDLFFKPKIRWQLAL